MRLIDADKLKAFYDKSKSGYKEIFKFFVDNQPTVDAVPIVRCKDCKHYANGMCWNALGMYSVKPDTDYCSKGKRKE